MKKYILNGDSFKSRQEAYEHISQVLEFPNYFGKNLDALWDLLSERTDQEILIENARSIPNYLDQYGLAILDVFGDMDGKQGMLVRIKW